jgi:indole-3-glycerol phosphate synthase
LIVAAFPGVSGEAELRALQQVALARGVDVLVEVHDEEELAIALRLGADLVGINNRNLATFEVDLATTERLAAGIPEGVVLVAESGIFTNDDIQRLERCGASAFLVGEALMREPDVGLALEKLRRKT